MKKGDRNVVKKEGDWKSEKLMSMCRKQRLTEDDRGRQGRQGHGRRTEV